MKNPATPRIAFIGATASDFARYGGIPSRFPGATLLDTGKNHGKGPAGTASPLAADRDLDGRFDVIVCLEPFDGIEEIRRARIVMVQKSYADEAAISAPWRSFADLCLTFGSHATGLMEPLCPCVAIGNPRYESWQEAKSRQEFRKRHADRLDPAKRTILFAPAAGTGPAKTRFRDAVAALTGDYNVIFKPAIKETPRGGDFTMVCDAQDDALNALTAADLVIGDFSELVLDAIYGAVPFILLKATGSKGTTGPKGTEACRIVTSPGQLTEAVRKIMAAPRSTIPAGLREELFANPENAAARAARLITELPSAEPTLSAAQQGIRRELRASHRAKADVARLRTFSGFVESVMDRIRKKFRPARPPQKKAVPKKQAKQAPKTKGTRKSEPVPASVLEIAHDLDPAELDGLLRGNAGAGGIRFVHVAHAPDAPPHSTLLSLARKSQAARDCLVGLSKNGYYAYCTKDASTRFVRSDLVASLWIKVKSGEFRMTPDGQVHSYSPPLSGEKPARLLVVLSTIYQNPNSASLHRYFMQNFPKLQKFIPHDTAVLRIGDIGGVLGSFYLNTVHRPDNVSSIQNLIESVRAEHGIDRDSVVLYGTSKGGTGAVHHGLLGRYRFVAVDPIVADEHYVKNLKDFHFTAGGVFPEVKEQVFEKLVAGIQATCGDTPPLTKYAVICSERSPQYPFITRILMDPLGDRMAFLNSRNANIKDHPDVAPNTLNTATMLINQQLYGLDLRPGRTDID